MLQFVDQLHDAVLRQVNFGTNQNIKKSGEKVTYVTLAICAVIWCKIMIGILYTNSKRRDMLTMWDLIMMQYYVR